MEHIKNELSDMLREESKTEDKYYYWLGYLNTLHHADMLSTERFNELINEEYRKIGGCKQ